MSQIDKKLEAVKRLDTGETCRLVAALYYVSSKTVWDWRRNRKNLEHFLTQGTVVGTDRKKWNFPIL